MQIRIWIRMRTRIWVRIWFASEQIGFDQEETAAAAGMELGIGLDRIGVSVCHHVGVQWTNLANRLYFATRANSEREREREEGEPEKKDTNAVAWGLFSTLNSALNGPSVTL